MAAPAYSIGGNAPNWLRLPCGVEIAMAPIDRAMVRAARRAVRRFNDAHADMDADERSDEAADLFSTTLMRLGLRDWRGLGDADGKPMGPPTPERIDAALADAVLFDQIDAAYIVPWARAAQEKNASSPLPNGISAGATRGKIIAGSAAAAKKGGATSAPIANMSRKRTRAKASGTSSPA